MPSSTPIISTTVVYFDLTVFKAKGNVLSYALWVSEAVMSNSGLLGGQCPYLVARQQQTRTQRLSNMFSAGVTVGEAGQTEVHVHHHKSATMVCLLKCWRSSFEQAWLLPPPENNVFVMAPTFIHVPYRYPSALCARLHR